MRNDMTKVSSHSHPFAVLIFNPASGNSLHYRPSLSETLAFLHGQGWKVDFQTTKAPGDAQQLAREAVAQKADLVIAAGGDGTIHEIIQELVGSETSLGVIPRGTGNLWAREMGIPLDNAGASGVLVSGQIRAIDLGCFNGHYFLLMAGIGLDGEVTRAMEKYPIKPFKRLGVLGYLLVGAWMCLGYASFQADFHIGERVVRISALQIVIGNTQLYGGPVRFTWLAKCDDGLLDICVVHQRNTLGRFAVFIDFLLHRQQRHQWVHYETCRTVGIRTGRPVAIMVDGELAGYTPEGDAYATFTVVPGALKVIVPEKTPEEIFS